MSINILDKLNNLSPTSFENLIFDLLKAGQLRNLVWRTPGADGGRDLQGDHIETDVSGYSKQVVWLIECKRYTNSVDWPTVWEKIAYADSGQADYLLIATTNNFTPRCIDEVNKWNLSRRMLKIRLWPVNEVIYHLEINAKVANKYGLTKENNINANTFVDLALHIARLSQSISAASLIGMPSAAAPIALAALSELMYIRSADLKEVGYFRTNGPLKLEIWPPFVDINNATNVSKFDRFGIRAFVFCLHMITKSNLALKDGDDNTIVIEGGQSLWNSYEKGHKLLEVTAFWGAIGVTKGNTGICLTHQVLR